MSEEAEQSSDELEETESSSDEPDGTDERVRARRQQRRRERNRSYDDAASRLDFNSPEHHTPQSERLTGTPDDAPMRVSTTASILKSLERLVGSSTALGVIVVAVLLLFLAWFFAGI